jgi:hypothetical protein
MVMSVCFNNLKNLGGNFCVPPLVTEVTISPWRAKVPGHYVYFHFMVFT